MEKVKMSLPSVEELRQLEVFQKYGLKMKVTDFSLLTGGQAYQLKEKVALGSEADPQILRERTSSYWTRTITEEGNVRYINHLGYDNISSPNQRYHLIRPMLYPTEELLPHLTAKRVNAQGVIEVPYGSYPQDALDYYENMQLERAYNNNQTKETGNFYTIDEKSYLFSPFGTHLIRLKEYQYLENRYIRLKTPTFSDGRFFNLSNGQGYCPERIQWLKVSPIVWLMDEPTGILVSKRGLLSGIAFHLTENTSYEASMMAHFIESHLSKEILHGTKIEHMSPVIPQNDALDKLTILEKRIRTLDPAAIHFKEEVAILGDYVASIRSQLETEKITSQNGFQKVKGVQK